MASAPIGDAGTPDGVPLGDDVVPIGSTTAPSGSAGRPRSAALTGGALAGATADAPAPPLVKICGLTRLGDVDLAVAAGADMVGFILVDWSPRGVDSAAAERLVARVPAGIETVGVWVDADPDEVERIADGLGLSRVQLHGAEPPEVVARFGARAIKAFRLPQAGPLYGETILLDRAFHARPTPEELAEHWAVARGEGEAGRRVLLAGALTVENVAEAVRAARPWAVDAARATESAPGIKDSELVRRFITAARATDRGGSAA